MKQRMGRKLIFLLSARGAAPLEDKAMSILGLLAGGRGHLQ